jgi:hypothetical protein
MAKSVKWLVQELVTAAYHRGFNYGLSQQENLRSDPDTMQKYQERAASALEEQRDLQQQLDEYLDEGDNDNWEEMQAWQKIGKAGTD